MSCQQGSDRSYLAGFVFLTQIWDCSVDSDLIDRNNCAKKFQKRIDNLSPPLLVSVPRDSGLVARKTGCPLSPNLIIIYSATQSHSPCGLLPRVVYHFFSDPGPKNDQRPDGNPFSNKDTSVALAKHSFSLSLFHHMMSSNIDMKIIRPWNWDVSPILLINSWTFLMNCNEVNPGNKIPLEFHRLSVNCVQSSVLWWTLEPTQLFFPNSIWCWFLIHLSKR